MRDMFMKLNVDQAVMLVVGASVVVTVLLALVAGRGWLLLTLLLGLHLMQIAFTGYCPLARWFEQLGLKRGNAFP
jgi:hypothetical protein